jgi:hypothetical protein
MHYRHRLHRTNAIDLFEAILTELKIAPHTKPLARNGVRVCRAITENASRRLSWPIHRLRKRARTADPHINHAGVMLSHMF